MSKENIEMAKEAKSVEELLALAKENNYPLTEEEAQNYFNQFHATGELSDDELDQVGGGCGGGKETYNKDGYWIIPYDCSSYYCSEFEQKFVGGTQAKCCYHCYYHYYINHDGLDCCKHYSIPK